MLLRSYAGIFAYCDLWFLEIHSWNMRLLIECDIFFDILTRSSSVPKKLDVLLLHLCYLITVTWFIEGYDFVDFSVLTGLYNRQPSSRIFSSPSTGTPSLSSHFLFFFPGSGQQLVTSCLYSSGVFCVNVMHSAASGDCLMPPLLYFHSTSSELLPVSVLCSLGGAEWHSILRTYHVVTIWVVCVLGLYS